MEDKKIKIGVIADDFTGAADAASFLSKNGLRTIMFNEVPLHLYNPCDAIVIALKVRNINIKTALTYIKQAIDFLLKIGCNQFYFKYCSTFDSTPQGNIGGVADFLMEYLHVSYTLLCPSLPVNGRVVKDGILYVNGRKLSESPLKDHPRNPMWDSYIPNLMKEQSKYPCYAIKRSELYCDCFQNRIRHYMQKNEHFYIIPDYENEQDGHDIAKKFHNLRLLTGGSGLLAYIPKARVKTITDESERKKAKRSIILCGSCSSATKRQVKYYHQKVGKTLSVNANHIIDGTLSVQSVIDYADSLDRPLLVYSDAIEKDIHELRKSDIFIRASECIENFMADASKKALKKGFDCIIVGGGETAGAVTKSLGFNGFYIGSSIDPGVPELFPLENQNITLILKSGNFGSDDFFVKAIS